ncbi:uncharacterized protein LTR77_004173 [Saxophila tyrrhenica]|uniref:Uncharacterized protein n=1 Tax=Saxophila tyrrhenica TaxID=1690608 RepID=A0AAV9PC85_9PEZI|nr:hypothetical protein LTR77_004173 [Saxophila tyrrhenica]
MGDQSGPEATGLFKLPPEVRNHIYGYYFKDGTAADTRIDLCKANDFHPDPAITAVCKAIRNETLEHYRQSIFISSGSIVASIAKLRSKPTLDRLTFDVEWQSFETLKVVAAACPNSAPHWEVTVADPSAPITSFDGLIAQSMAEVLNDPNRWASSPTMTAQITAEEDDGRVGLLKLPPELRNRFYDFCFAPAHHIDADSEINLVKAYRYLPDPAISPSPECARRSDARRFGSIELSSPPSGKDTTSSLTFTRSTLTKSAISRNRLSFVQSRVSTASQQ